MENTIATAKALYAWNVLSVKKSLFQNFELNNELYNLLLRLVKQFADLMFQFLQE